MSRKLMSVLMTLGLLSSVAIALTVTPPDFATDVIHRVYPTKADFDGIFAEVARPDFDWTFTEVETTSTLDLQHAAADREKIRLAVLKQMNLGQFEE
jgi:hypothetical protein